MTSLIQHASSGRVVPHRSEPTAARTFNWHLGQGDSGTDSLRLDYRIFHRRKTSGNHLDTSTKATLTRSERQGMAGDSASSQPTRTALPDESAGSRITARVAISPVVALGIAVISSTTSSREQEGRRRGTVDRLR
jgi:hypothetical protein